MIADGGVIVTSLAVRVGVAANRDNRGGRGRSWSDTDIVLASISRATAGTVAVRLATEVIIIVGGIVGNGSRRNECCENYESEGSERGEMHFEQ